MPKVYPYHPSLSYAYYEDINFDKVVENLVLNKLALNHYFRERIREVDFLKVDGKNILPVKVKNTKNIDIKKLKSLLWFMDKFNVRDGWVVYLGENKTVKVNNNTIHCKSIYELLYS